MKFILYKKGKSIYVKYITKAITKSLKQILIMASLGSRHYLNGGKLWKIVSLEYIKFTCSDSPGRPSLHQSKLIHKIFLANNFTSLLRYRAAQTFIIRAVTYTASVVEYRKPE